MELREQINKALKTAMRERQQVRLRTIRLINAAIKDRDIAARGEEGVDIVSDAEVRKILGRMVKQRVESARAYEEAARLELAEAEREEIEVIEEFLPRQLSEEEIEKAIAEVVAETGASSIRDMGRVMGVLRERYMGQMDFATVGPKVKIRIG
ncbi:GatB/YqeY domain-containing protein [Palleronia caenipelagi]|uniref:GatB/YqeY domain-containing protein n=1 Tax=Palleronia caenipelagi TaxID=2489174 RepID=A0A547Q5T9_9RHOB|nr:GatB/YqeY domain-containing protein [Palleronia caenipelagi]TRD21755.1 GatB/YqeY domain-containing protein [Palleronia caenipelagi]